MSLFGIIGSRIMQGNKTTAAEETNGQQEKASGSMMIVRGVAAEIAEAAGINGKRIINNKNKDRIRR